MKETILPQSPLTQGDSMKPLRQRIIDILDRTTCGFCAYEESNGELLRHCPTCSSMIVGKVLRALSRKRPPAKEQP